MFLFLYVAYFVVIEALNLHQFLISAVKISYNDKKKKTLSGLEKKKLSSLVLIKQCTWMKQYQLTLSVQGHYDP